jgi:PAS domain S-box-containing protein
MPLPHDPVRNWQFPTLCVLALAAGCVVLCAYIVAQPHLPPVWPEVGLLAAVAIVIVAIAWSVRIQRRASEQLRASEQRYRLVADNASDLVCLHGLDGIYQWVSPSATALTGWTPEQLVGRDPYEFFHPDDIERVRRDSHAILLGSGSTTTISYRLRRADGSHIWLETVNRLVCDADGRPMAIQTASRDISQRKADEARLAEVQRAAAMAERMASIGTLAGGVAHEFNNLNAVVMGNVEMALRRPDLPPEARRRLDQIRDAVDREKGIVEALLAFSRSERGSTEVVDLGRIASTTLALARRTLRQRRVTLAVELPPEPVFATIPAGSLGQVLLNLLLNACDAIDRRDDPRIWVSLQRKGNRGMLCVRDNGIGIEPELAMRIFEPFFSTKGEHATAGHGQPWLHGSGLGLSVCQTLVGQMGGTITLESRPGEGATFTVSVPLSDAPRPVADPTVTPTPCARVLVVDDEPEIRRLLCEHLIAAGHVAVEAKDGHQALDHLGHEEIDLVLLNWSMPGLDGQGVLEHIELHPERSWPPIVVVSGWTGSGSGIDRWRREIVGQLRKPFSLDQVRSSVDRALCGLRDASDDDSSKP